jgi:hypothetical protein
MLSGFSWFKLFKLSTVLKKEVFEMKNVKHKERGKAIKWFLAGVTKETICGKLGITENIFRVWVGGYDDFKQFRKNMAFVMFKADVDENEICRQLGIGEEKLNKWVKEGYDKELKTAVIPKQYRGGLHPWVTNICKSVLH